MSFVIGMWSTDVFGEAAGNDGFIEVDFLNGQVGGQAGSDNLRAAVKRYGELLPEFCRSNGADVGDLAALTATFYAEALGRRVSVDVTDRLGKRSVTDYVGLPLKRVRSVDPLGRVRRTPARRELT